MKKQSYHYSINRIKALKKYAEYRKMSLPDGFVKCSAKRLQKCYNGIGPDAWSDKFRKAVTWALRILEAPALIHDYEYTYGDRSYWRFTKANWRLMANSWIDCRFRAGLAAGILCQLFGWHGFKHLRDNKKGSK